MDIQYHQVTPENAKSSYGEFDSMDFVLTFEGRSLVRNSIRINARLSCFKTGGDFVDDDTILIDPSAGSHALFHSIQSEFETMGMVENLQEYPRMYRMMSDGLRDGDSVFNSNAVCELRASSENKANKIIRSRVDFSCKPTFCLNQIVGENLPFRKSGYIRISLKLARNYTFLFGSGVTNSSSFKLEDVNISFMTVPDSNQNKSIVMRTRLNIKQNVNSNFTNISTKVPAVCHAVSCSFQQQDRENTATNNNLQTEALPVLDRLQFLFNDSTNKYITYEIKDREEMIDRYLESFHSAGVNNMSLERLKSNDGFGIGLDFGNYIDLSNQKFNLQLNSQVNSVPYVIYMYFHSILKL